MKTRIILLFAAMFFAIGAMAQDENQQIKGVQLKIMKGFSEDVEFVNIVGELFNNEKPVRVFGASLSYLMPLKDQWGLDFGCSIKDYHYKRSIKDIAPPYLDEISSDSFSNNSDYNFSLGADAHLVRYFDTGKNSKLSVELGTGFEVFLYDGTTTGSGQVSEDFSMQLTDFVMKSQQNDDLSGTVLSSIDLGVAYNFILRNHHMISIGANYQYAFSSVKMIDYSFNLNDPYVSEATSEFTPSYIGISLAYGFLF